MTQFTLIDTVIGWAALIWGEQGLVGVRLPEADADRSRRSVMRRFPEAIEGSPPAELEPVMAGVQALMRGEKADLTGAPLDLSRTPEFNAKVYAIARAIPPGETLTYGEIAVRLGDKLLARDVGGALGANPWPLVVPCHRVTAAGGKLGGFSAPGGANTKFRLLEIEGAAVVSAAAVHAKPRRKPTEDQPSLF